MPDSIFDELESTLTCGGVEPALVQLAEHFRAERRYHELFDTRLMQARRQLGLPIVLTSPLDELPEPERSQLEDAYLEACREVGRLLLDEGKVREAWVYLRPTDQASAVAKALEKMEPTDDNLSDLIGVALHEGVAPAYGYSLILSHYGTCNAITTFDAELGRFRRQDQQAAAALLLRQMHADLTENVRAHIKQQEAAEPGAAATTADATLDELVADREWLFEGGNYHLDTTHLSSAVRIARIVENPELIRLAWELTEYGRRLDTQYQFAGEEPFADVYPSHGFFYSAQLGKHVDEAVAYFRQKAESVTIDNAGSMPAETYIALLARLGRLQEAMEASVRLLPAGTRTSGFAPSLLELSKLADDYAVLRDSSRQRGELLAYAVALIAGQS
ncbi:MAG: hypothetical protein WD894_18230 [Pirellulales bacterium]